MKIVHVTWIDSSSRSGWVFSSDGPCDPTKCETVGFLVHEDEVYIELCSSLGDVGSKNEVRCGSMAIPKCCIKTRQTLLEIPDVA